MMMTGILPESEFPKALAVMNRNANNLKRLINDLLDMSAILSGKMVFEEKSIPFAGLLEESVETMQSYGGEAGVTLTLNVAPDAGRQVSEAIEFGLTNRFAT